MRSGLRRSAVALVVASFGCATSGEEHTTFVDKLARWRGRDVSELFQKVGKPMRTYDAPNGNPVVVYEIRTAAGGSPDFATVTGGSPYFGSLSNETRLCRIEFEVDRQDQRVIGVRPSGDGCP
jgi:hypothetical protein